MSRALSVHLDLRLVVLRARRMLPAICASISTRSSSAALVPRTDPVQAVQEICPLRCGGEFLELLVGQTLEMGDELFDLLSHHLRPALFIMNMRRVRAAADPLRAEARALD